jgi:hypothetical protein
MSKLAIGVRTTLIVALQTIGALALSMPSSALAQEAEAVDPPAVPIYHVEVLIFRHLDQSRTTEETHAPLDQGLPPDFDIERLDEIPAATTPGDSTGGAPATVAQLATRHAASSVKFLLLEPVPAPPDFVQLLPAQFKLTETWDTLNDVEAYEPVLHIAWLQTARAEAEAVPYDLVITAADPDVVTGTVTLYKQRFLHFDVDLTMREADDPADNSASGFWSRFSFVLDDEDVVYRIHQSRRIRGDALQYFDHPQFGVIAGITKLVVEEGDGPETAARAL